MDYKNIKPFVKWAGGKRQILSKINEFINDSICDDNFKNNSYTYIEPFLGGGAVFFDKRPSRAIINDLNEDLMNAYSIIKSEKYLDLINELKYHETEYKKDPHEYFYSVRLRDRVDDWKSKYNDVQRAARMIFLNRTCYNGLYRVNNSGQFNTPIGRYKNPTICDEENLVEIHKYLSDPTNSIEIMCDSYESAINKARDGDVIYIDPPYDYEDDDGFTKYHMTGFTFEDFKKLKSVCDAAIDRGAFVVISNNATKKVFELFEEDPKYNIVFYDFSKFRTLRNINCKGGERKTGYEVIFWGMNNNIPFPQANDMNKVIRLLMMGEDAIMNKEACMQIIDVTTTRQVAYYLSALQFFNYLKHNKKYTKQALTIYNDENAIRKDIYKKLKNDEIFNTVYLKFKKTKSINVPFVSKFLEKKNENLSGSTIYRRSQTIKSWVEWMYETEKDWDFA